MGWIIETPQLESSCFHCKLKALLDHVIQLAFAELHSHKSMPATVRPAYECLVSRPAIECQIGVHWLMTANDTTRRWTLYVQESLLLELLDKISDPHLVQHTDAIWK